MINLTNHCIGFLVFVTKKVQYIPFRVKYTPIEPVGLLLDSCPWGQFNSLLTAQSDKHWNTTTNEPLVKHHSRQDHNADRWYHLNYSANAEFWLCFYTITKLHNMTFTACGLRSVSWFLILFKETKTKHKIFSHARGKIFDSTMKYKLKMRNCFIFKYLLVPNNNIHVLSGRKPSTPC